MILLHCLTTIPLAAQGTSTGEIHGRVVIGASTTPVASATVDISVVGAGVARARAIAATDGRFRAEGLAPGRYQLRLRALGYASRTLEPVVVGTSGVDVGPSHSSPFRMSSSPLP